jgi:hypothetical protein
MWDEIERKTINLQNFDLAIFSDINDQWTC